MMLAQLYPQLASLYTFYTGLRHWHDCDNRSIYCCQEVSRRGKDSSCVCVCVCLRERERESERQLSGCKWQCQQCVCVCACMCVCPMTRRSRCRSTAGALCMRACSATESMSLIRLNWYKIWYLAALFRRLSERLKHFFKYGFYCGSCSGSAPVDVTVKSVSYLGKSIGKTGD